MDGQSYISPGEIRKDIEQLASLSKQIENISNVPNILRREFLGQSFYQDDDGNGYWIQTSKPLFVKIDFEDGKPKKRKVHYKYMADGEEVEEYIANEEAVEEILGMVKFMGLNNVSPVSINSENNYLDDLKEFECKLAVLLGTKRKDWGLEKDMLPMLQTKIKTLVADVRSMSVNGQFLKTLQTTVQRVEQHIETQQKRKEGSFP